MVYPPERKAYQYVCTDKYTGDRLLITADGPKSTVTLRSGLHIFQFTPQAWTEMCQKYLEAQAPGVPGHNTQEENAR